MIFGGIPYIMIVKIRDLLVEKNVGGVIPQGQAPKQPDAIFFMLILMNMVSIVPSMGDQSGYFILGIHLEGTRLVGRIWVL